MDFVPRVVARDASGAHNTKDCLLPVTRPIELHPRIGQDRKNVGIKNVQLSLARSPVKVLLRRVLKELLSASYNQTNCLFQQGAHIEHIYRVIREY